MVRASRWCGCWISKNKSTGHLQLDDRRFGEKLIRLDPEPFQLVHDSYTSIPAMIVRNFGLRHGRQVLAAPSSCLVRAASTQATVAVAEEHRAVSASDAAALERIKARKLKLEIQKMPKAFMKKQAYHKETHKWGSQIERRYVPDEILRNPPHDASLEDLMAAQVHMGHYTSRWNPANSRYIYGERSGIHIIALETTAAHLRRAARVVEEVSYHGGLVLFVGTRKGQKPIVVRASELAGACYLFSKWLPGMISNKDTALANGDVVVVDELDRPLEGFEEHLQDRRPLSPDLVVCLNPLENYVLLQECAKANIPTIGVIDTDADPSWVTYQIPGNDDSIRSISLLAMVLARAGERGQERRLADAREGVVKWENPREVQQFILRAKSAERRKEKEALEKAAEELEKERKTSERLTDEEILEKLLA
ncbi:putative mitochondrial SSU ribosomal protein S2 precursor [Podospora australis]|uniref:Mitochondrial SSU ribosomal protein S2 n=1 Tax=Podospora australis TaxID=1536484 RepID=A0AAN6WT57_9PEZI|nr:putative mitochondrial SSU ribosomal protein S2 precursor [Podospora australis]